MHGLIEKNPQRDDLTGLPNASLFREQCEKIMEESTKTDKNFALHLFRLANAGDIVMDFGLPQAESYLKVISNRLYGILKEDKILARIESNLFGLLQRDIGHEGHARYLARRVHESLQEPVDVDGETIQIKLYSGLALFPTEGDDVDMLLNTALESMEQPAD